MRRRAESADALCGFPSESAAVAPAACLTHVESAAESPASTALHQGRDPLISLCIWSLVEDILSQEMCTILLNL